MHCYKSLFQTCTYRMCTVGFSSYSLVRIEVHLLVVRSIYTYLSIYLSMYCDVKAERYWHSFNSFRSNQGILVFNTKQIPCVKRDYLHTIVIEPKVHDLLWIFH